MSQISHLSHGGRTGELARAAGIPEDALLDFSANINPIGPAPWLSAALEEGARRVGVYPDPDSSEACEAAARRYGVPADRFIFADGGDSLIFVLPRALGAVSCIMPSPTYSGYIRSASRAGIRPVRLQLDAADGFSLSSEAFIRALDAAIAGALPPVLVFLGAPNNPVGGSLEPGRLLQLAGRHPEAVFALDESFAELAGDDTGMIGSAAPNLVVLRSLTKTWSVPGARVGFACAERSIVTKLRSELPAWPLSCFAQAIASRALADREFAASSAAFIAQTEAVFVNELAALGYMKIHRSGANFLLLESPTPGRGELVARRLLEAGIAVRVFSPEEGLDGRFIRVAVRKPEENARLVKVLKDIPRQVRGGCDIGWAK